MTFASRFDGWSKSASALVLALLVLVMGWGAVITADPTEGAAALAAERIASGRKTDLELYTEIVAGLRAGKGYYEAVGENHRALVFPLKPFLAVRLPTLATLTAALGTEGVRNAGALLLAAALLAWFQAVRRETSGGGLSHAASDAAGYVLAGAIALSAWVLLLGKLSGFHESLAAILILLSLALWRTGPLPAAIAAGLAASLVRETALAYLLLMAVAAGLDRRWRESAGWGASIAVVAACLYLHAGAVAAIGRPGDLVSEGWNGREGWPMYLASVAATSPLIFFPTALAHALVPVSLFGWVSWKSGLGLRVAGLMLGYGLMIMLFARPENVYWALLTTPFLIAGIALSVPAIRGLLQQLSGAAGRVRDVVPVKSKAPAPC